MRIEHTSGEIEIFDCGGAAMREIKTRLTLPNPRYIGAVKAGKKPFGIPKVLEYYTAHGDTGLTIPGGCMQMALTAADRAGEAVDAETQLQTLPEVNYTFRGDLRLYQLAALAQVTRQDFGVLEAPTGSGKTVMGCYAIAQRRQPALITVHNKMLQAQWVEAVQRFLGIEAGTIGGGKPRHMSSPVIVAIINSLSKCADVLDEDIGHLVADECHRVVSPVWWHTIKHFGCRYRLGLSATPYRRDGLTDAIGWALGPTTTVERELLVRSGHVLPTEVEQVGTDFVTDIDPSEHYQAVISAVVTDGDRNRQIVDQAASACADGLVLVLSDRVEHLEMINYHTRTGGGVMLHGQLGAAARRDAEAKIAAGKAPVILATTQLVGEGFNLPAASTAILATPIKWSGRLLQAIGRVLRPAPGKTHGRIIDLCDWNVPILANGARARARVYRELAEAEGGKTK